MDNISPFVLNGGSIRLPVGYRFCPTDQELVAHYLKRKVFHLPLPASIIPDFDIFLTDPWALPGDSKEKRFFFSKQKSFSRRSAGCGIWKSIGKEKLILSPGPMNQLVGSRKTLVFSESKFCETKSATRWVMHEYRLPRSASPTTPNSTQIEVGDWAVYSLFQKRRRPKRQGVEEKQRLREAEEASILDLRVEDGWEFPQPSSSSSSGVTEVSSNADQEEHSSSLGLGLGLGFSSYFSQAHVRGV
ncbi:hypothetical protein IC582_014145 [Cucumis melo]|nr:NAC domain-containing protein 83 isoform X2 [Cucumis melo]